MSGNVLVFSQSNDYKRGTWKGLKLAGGGRSASYVCPECGEQVALVDHEIAEDGRVYPSVVCPTEGCGFHRHIRLEGWEG